MSLTSSLAVYFVIWWIVLFVVLPWGIQSQHEAGASDHMADPGAPVRPRIGLKVLVTTAIAALIFAVFWICVQYRLVTLDSFPFLLDYTSS